MSKYRDFEKMDFVWEDHFRRWVQAPTPALEAYWQQWLADNPGKEALLQEARQVVLAMSVRQRPLSEAEISDRVRQTVSQFQVPEIVLPASPWYNRHWPQLAAAVAFLILSSIWLYTHQGGTSDRVYEEKVSAATTPLIEKINQENKSLQVRLSDKSLVTLYKGSRISYSPAFPGPVREVYLSGEAVFEVARDPKKPFLVHANELVTKVLGTSFHIKAYATDPEVSVAVLSGRVSVFSSPVQENPEPVAVVLAPNQQVVFSRTADRLVKSLVARPALLQAQAGGTAAARLFNFSDTPVSEVFELLEQNYGIPVIFDEGLMQDCPFTGALNNQSFFEKLTIICKAIEARYEVVDGQVVVYGKGCDR